MVTSNESTTQNLNKSFCTHDRNKVKVVSNKKLDDAVCGVVSSPSDEIFRDVMCFISVDLISFSFRV